MLVATPQLAGDYKLALYNHRSDPDLMQDVSAEAPAIIDKLRPVLAEWHAELDGASKVVSEKSEDEEQALRALGYIE